MWSKNRLGDEMNATRQAVLRTGMGQGTGKGATFQRQADPETAFHAVWRETHSREGSEWIRRIILQHSPNMSSIVRKVSEALNQEQVGTPYGAAPVLAAIAKYSDVIRARKTALRTLERNGERDAILSVRDGTDYADTRSDAQNLVGTL